MKSTAAKDYCRIIDVSTRLENEYERKTWEYIDLEEHDFQIRQEERIKEYMRRKNERERKAAYRAEKISNLKTSIKFRLIAVFAIWVSFLLIRLGVFDKDATFVVMVVLPLALFMIFCPSRVYKDIYKNDENRSE